MSEEAGATQPISPPGSEARQDTGQSPPRLWKDRYLIEKELGRGGFGVVYLARDQQLLSKPVVIKVLHEEGTPDPYFQKKFQQEIEALARIDHPGVVGVLDVGHTPDGKPFLVMQFVEGATLRSLISGRGMELRQVARILRQVGQALSAAHEKGVYHRDLKPENIMLQSLGEGELQVKLIDFGIATVKDSQVAAHTQTSKVVGTLAYMAPEQVLGKPSPASDIYALGVISYEMLTGQRPENSSQGVTVKPRELRADLPEAAQEAILKALSYLPENRQARPREFGDQLATALREEPARSAPLPAVRPAALPPQFSPSSSGLEMAYVLFMDLVGYSTMPMDLQSQRIQKLVEIVRNTQEFRRAQQSDQIISLPTGDGMALVFFQNPVAPVQCATEISRELKNRPELQLRMGVHSGLVYRIADINTNRNVAGGGINLAQRVMDCGDAGHILVSKSVADDLGQLSDWEPLLHDLGEAEVKHGVKVHVVNLFTGEVGNPALPVKLQKGTLVPQPASLPQPQPVPQLQPQFPAAKSRSGALVAVGVATAVVVLTVVAFQFGPWRKSAEETRPATPPAQTAPRLAAPGMIPPPASPPPTTPPTGSATAPTPPPASGLPETAVAPARTPSAESRRAAPQQAAASAPAAATSAPPTSSPPVAQVPAAQTGPSSADRAALQEMRERMILLAARASTVSRSMQNIEAQQNRAGLGMRGDMAAARQSMEYLLGEASASLAAGDAATTKRNLDLAERQIEKLEGFLGR